MRSTNNAGMFCEVVSRKFQSFSRPLTVSAGDLAQILRLQCTNSGGLSSEMRGEGLFGGVSGRGRSIGDGVFRRSSRGVRCWELGRFEGATDDEGSEDVVGLGRKTGESAWSSHSSKLKSCLGLLEISTEGEGKDFPLTGSSSSYQTVGKS